jgi:hypothetical protein
MHRTRGKTHRSLERRFRNSMHRSAREACPGFGAERGASRATVRPLLPPYSIAPIQRTVRLLFSTPVWGWVVSLCECSSSRSLALVPVWAPGTLSGWVVFALARPPVFVNPVVECMAPVPPLAPIGTATLARPRLVGPLPCLHSSVHPQPRHRLAHRLHCRRSLPGAPDPHLRQCRGLGIRLLSRGGGGTPCSGWIREVGASWPGPPEDLPTGLRSICRGWILQPEMPGEGLIPAPVAPGGSRPEAASGEQRPMAMAN